MRYPTAMISTHEIRVIGVIAGGEGSGRERQETWRVAVAVAGGSGSGSGIVEVELGSELKTRRVSLHCELGRL